MRDKYCGLINLKLTIRIFDIITLADYLRINNCLKAFNASNGRNKTLRYTIGPRPGLNNAMGPRSARPHRDQHNTGLKFIIFYEDM